MKFITSLCLLMLLVACNPAPSVSYNYAETLQSVRLNKLAVDEELAAITEIKAGILLGRVDPKDIGTSMTEIKLLTARNTIKMKQSVLEQMRGLDPSSEHYKTLQWIVDDIDGKNKKK